MNGADGNNVLYIAGDNEAGSARSGLFQLYAGTDRVTFLMCGGADLPNGLSVRRSTDDVELRKVNPGTNSNNAYSVSCGGLSAHTGQIVYIFIEKARGNNWHKLVIDAISIEDANGQRIPCVGSPITTAPTTASPTPDTSGTVLSS